MYLLQAEHDIHLNNLNWHCKSKFVTLPIARLLTTVVHTTRNRNKVCTCRNIELLVFVQAGGHCRIIGLKSKTMAFVSACANPSSSNTTSCRYTKTAGAYTELISVGPGLAQIRQLSDYGHSCSSSQLSARTAKSLKLIILGATSYRFASDESGTTPVPSVARYAISLGSRALL